MEFFLIKKYDLNFILLLLLEFSISCWMSTEKGTIWAFAAPVVLILLVSIRAVICTVIHMYACDRLIFCS